MINLHDISIEKMNDFWIKDFKITIDHNILDNWRITYYNYWDDRTNEYIFYPASGLPIRFNRKELTQLEEIPPLVINID